jgi:hypothetical protein
VTVTISGTAETPLRLPDHQHLYGQVYDGQFRFVDGQGGGTLNTNIAVSNSGERHHVRLSLSDTRLNSIAPNSSIHRVGLALKAGIGITSRLSAEATLN